jgi:Flp pilus assembly protein TadG
MKPKFQEKGQALIVIALAAVVLFGFTALAIDGSRSFEDKRHAQNAADTAALAGALAYSRNNDINTAALNRATSNGYDDGASSDVTITVTDAPAGVCPANTLGKDIKVDIVSTIDTSLAKVIGQNTLTNAVTSTARSCGFYYGPPFNGNAIVALAPSGKGFDGSGTPDWKIECIGIFPNPSECGGIFSNSSDSNAAYCNGAAGIDVPSVTVVGGTNFGCHGSGTIGPITTDAPQYTYPNMAGFFPRQPACNGNAYQSAGKWYPQAGADGSKVIWSGNMVFTAGLYCVTNSPGSYHDAITGTKVTFYLMAPNFNFKLAGSGASFTASAPITGEYRGILLYLPPQLDANGNLIQNGGNQTQQIDLRGNGNAEITGTILAPSADVTMFGNSGSKAFNSQIIAYHVDSGGNANIKISYNPKRNYYANLPIILSLLK